MTDGDELDDGGDDGRDLEGYVVVQGPAIEYGWTVWDSQGNRCPGKSRRGQTGRQEQHRDPDGQQ